MTTTRPGGKKQHRRATTAILMLVPAVAIAGVVATRAGSTGNNTYRAATHFYGGITAPIPGRLVSQAQLIVDVGNAPIPSLSPTIITDPCGGGTAPLTALATWEADGPGTTKQIGITYSDGVWLAATPLAAVSPRVLQGGELAPVATAIPNPNPRLVTGTVRAHVAWEASLTPAFSCKDGQPVQAPSAPASPNPGLPAATATNSTVAVTVPQSAVDYPVTETADIEWVEHGYLVEVNGPFDVSTLLAIADGLKWS